MADLEMKISQPLETGMLLLLSSQQKCQSRGWDLRYFHPFLSLLLTLLSNRVDHVLPGKINSTACGITDNLKEVCQHMWEHNSWCHTQQPHTVKYSLFSPLKSNVWKCKPWQNNLPGCRQAPWLCQLHIKIISHWGVPRHRAQTAWGRGQLHSTPQMEGNDAQLSSHCPTGTEDGQCWTGWINPRITAATPASAILLHHPPAVSWNSHFPLGNLSPPLLVPWTCQTDPQGSWRCKRHRLTISALW